jgi:hypothetical protein
MNLEDIIRGLIESKREDDYWDFKREPYDNNANLLHDLLCLANSLHKGDKYLILGVTDPKEGATVIGLAPNQTNRKTQVQYIDFLSNKVFAGDYRPEIELKIIIIDNKEVDVLIVFDRHLKPYYLSKDYSEQGKIVRANFIYTRINDRNTPIDRSADIQIVEKMWQQRFGFDLPIVERMKLLLLQPDNWFKDLGNKNYSYHKKFPEFRIKFSRPNRFDQPEAYSFFFPNESSFLGEATFKYNSTTLFKLNYIYCDEMRIIFAEPETQYLQLTNLKNWYHYYDLDTELGKFLYFLTEGLTQKVNEALFSHL